LLLVLACAGDDSADSVTVFAAASLTDAFEEAAEAFEAANPGVTVELNFAASSALREQILEGAPADVFASANTSNMDEVVEGGEAEDPAPFVENQLEIAVPAGNEAGVTGLADFGVADLLIGLCAEEVPCGEFGREALANAGVAASVDTNEPDVRSLLTKIEAGELDAGIVYRTDVLAAGDAVQGIEIPAGDNVVATYPIAALTGSANPDAADAFVAFILSAEGQEILTSYGFDTAA
jgi:molybdate transport system substrate-binding protein